MPIRVGSHSTRKREEVTLRNITLDHTGHVLKCHNAVSLSLVHPLCFLQITRQSKPSKVHSGSMQHHWAKERWLPYPITNLKPGHRALYVDLSWASAKREASAKVMNKLLTFHTAFLTACNCCFLALQLLLFLPCNCCFSCPATVP